MAIDLKNMKHLFNVVDSRISDVENYSNLDEGLQEALEYLRNDFDLLRSDGEDAIESVENFLGDFN